MTYDGGKSDRSYFRPSLKQFRRPRGRSIGQRRICLSNWDNGVVKNRSEWQSSEAKRPITSIQNSGNTNIHVSVGSIKAQHKSKHSCDEDLGAGRLLVVLDERERLRLFPLICKWIGTQDRGKLNKESRRAWRFYDSSNESSKNRKKYRLRKSCFTEL